MDAPTASRLLEAWEGAVSAPEWERPLWLLAAADCDPEQTAALALGERDVRLLELSEAVFGPEFTGVSACPQCEERLELRLNASALQGQGMGHEGDRLSLHVDGFDVCFRVPNTRDLAAASGCRTVEEARRVIFQRCVLTWEGQEEDTPVEKAPEEVVQAVARSMAEADPLAACELALSCPVCGHQWNVPFDVGSFVWTEFNAWARKRLEEVHVLASAYGWSESAILQLSPIRRRYYMEAILR